MPTSDGESSEDELSPGRSNAESPSDASKETIPPTSSGTRRRHRHRRRRFRPTYLVAAICAVVVAGLLVAGQGSWPFAASTSGGPASVATPSGATPSASYPTSAISSLPIAVGSPEASASPTAAASTHAIVANRIVISRLGIDLKVIEGDGLDAPLGKVAHFPGTAWPGGGSNIYLYAHAQDGMFIKLWNARIGDEVVLTLVDGSERRYVVSQIRPNVTWDDMSVLAPTSTEELTLQTCTSYQYTAPRFLVIAIPEQ